MPNPENLRPKPWKKGQSGNPAGYSRSRRISDALVRLIEAHKLDDRLALTWIGAALGDQSILKGRKPDYSFFRELLDRTEGKVADKLITEQQEIVVKRKDKPKGRGKRGGAKRPPRKPPSGSGAGD